MIKIKAPCGFVKLMNPLIYEAQPRISCKGQNCWKKANRLYTHDKKEWLILERDVHPLDFSLSPIKKVVEK